MATNGPDIASIDLATINGAPTAIAADLMDSPRGWIVTAVAFLGMFLSMGVLVVYSFGVLATAMAEDLGISFSQLTTIFMVYSLSVVVACPVWGVLVDRFGGRKITIISSLMLAGLFCLLTVLPRNVTYVYMAFIAIGLFASGTLPAPYASIVVGWFDKRRGLALGVTMMGIGVGAAAIPPLSAILLAHFGWRNTFLLYAFLIVFVCVPMMVAFLKPHPAAVSARVASLNEPRLNLLKQAATMPTTWMLAIFALLTGIIMVGSVTTFVPMLQAQGMTRSQAAGYQSIVGISLILGRIIVGGLIDRIFAPRVMMAVLAITSLGYFSMYSANSPAAYALSAAGIGLAIGAEMDFLAFLVSRYYAKPAFGTLFGFFFAMYALGAAFGPLTVGWLAATYGSYQPGLLVLGVATVVLMLSMLLLPRYDQRRSDAV
jgi:MFS family permease